MNKSEIILPQLSSSSLFVRGAVWLASNQHFNLASWHYQFADRPGSFVRALLDPVLFKGLSALSLRHSSAPANESLPIYSPVASFASFSLSPRRIRCLFFVFLFKSMNREVAALQVEFTRSYLRAHCLSLSLSALFLLQHIEGEVHLWTRSEVHPSVAAFPWQRCRNVSCLHVLWGWCHGLSQVRGVPKCSGIFCNREQRRDVMDLVYVLEIPSFNLFIESRKVDGALFSSYVPTHAQFATGQLYWCCSVPSDRLEDIVTLCTY